MFCNPLVDKLTALLLIVLPCVGCSAQNEQKDVYKESAWTQRDTWQRADEIIAHLNLKRESTVADIGCHEGYFTFKLADKVVQGRVYAVDISQAKLETLRKRILELNKTNITPILGSEDNAKLPVPVDAILIVDTYHEMKAHDTMLQYLYEHLKPGGRIVLCEPIAKDRKDLSRAEQEKKHELAIHYAVDDLRKAGFKILTRVEDFVDRVAEKGDKMWLIVAEK
jgi:cyclopropane fatty-acyl-phospholipid synthase-like methyltransferase